MLCVDLKNSFYQLPDVHRGLYDLNCSNPDEEILNPSTKIETIQEEKIPSNEYFSDLVKQDLIISKFSIVIFSIMLFLHQVVCFFVFNMNEILILQFM